jgi:hypothetical protein
VEIRHRRVLGLTPGPEAKHNDIAGPVDLFEPVTPASDEYHGGTIRDVIAKIFKQRVHELVELFCGVQIETPIEQSESPRHTEGVRIECLPEDIRRNIIDCGWPQQAVVCFEDRIRAVGPFEELRAHLESSASFCCSSWPWPTVGR